MWRHWKGYFTDNILSTIQKIAVGYVFREAVLEIKLYFCPVDERMTNIGEKLSFVAEVLRGVLMGF